MSFINKKTIELYINIIQQTQISENEFGNVYYYIMVVVGLIEPIIFFVL